MILFGLYVIFTKFFKLSLKEIREDEIKPERNTTHLNQI